MYTHKFFIIVVTLTISHTPLHYIDHKGFFTCVIMMYVYDCVLSNKHTHIHKNCILKKSYIKCSQEDDL